MLRWCVLALALLLAGCGEQDAQQAIEASGFAEVALSNGVVWWGCDSKSDNVFMNHGFTAKAVNGHQVEGVACGGVFKGYTVRIMKVLP